MDNLTLWERFREFMGWHKPIGMSTFDGASLHNRCMYCGKDIMRDSQGNWF